MTEADGPIGYDRGHLSDQPDLSLHIHNPLHLLPYNGEEDEDLKDIEDGDKDAEINAQTSRQVTLATRALACVYRGRLPTNPRGEP